MTTPASLPSGPVAQQTSDPGAARTTTGLMHGEADEDLDRLMWRVSVGTTGALGVPAGALHFDSRYAIADS